MNPKRILIVDDDLFISDLYSLELQKEGFIVVSASSGEVGLSKVQLEKPALILLDIAMPGLDGIQVLQKIRANHDFDRIKILLLTNIRDEETIRNGLSKGADGYLLKTSLTPEQVVEEVKKALS